MAVMLPNAALTLLKRAHPQGRDDHGTPVASSGDVITSSGPFPGAIVLAAEGGYNARLDPRHWPVRESDQINDDQGRTFVIKSEPRLVQLPGDDSVDFIRAYATLDPPLVP